MPIYKIPNLNPINHSTNHANNVVTTNSYNKTIPNSNNNNTLKINKNNDVNNNVRFNNKNDFSSKNYDVNEKDHNKNNNFNTKYSVNNYNNPVEKNNFNNNITNVLENNIQKLKISQKEPFKKLPIPTTLKSSQQHKQQRFVNQQLLQPSPKQHQQTSQQQLPFSHALKKSPQNNDGNNESIVEREVRLQRERESMYAHFERTEPESDTDCIPEAGLDLLSGNSFISRNSFVPGHSFVSGNPYVSGNTYVSGNPYVSGKSHVSGTIPGDTSSCSGYHTLESSRLASPEVLAKDVLDGGDADEDCEIHKSKPQKRTTVMPYEDSINDDNCNNNILPQNETVLEKEVRVARQREGSLRRARGFPLKLIEEKFNVSFLVPSQESNKVLKDRLGVGSVGANGSLEKVDEVGRLKNNSQTFATNRLRMEILRESQRELDMKKHIVSGEDMNVERSENRIGEMRNERKFQTEHTPYAQYFENNKTRNNFRIQNIKSLKTPNDSFIMNGRKEATRGVEDRTDFETKIEEEIEECQKREDELRWASQNRYF